MYASCLHIRISVCVRCECGDNGVRMPHMVIFAHHYMCCIHIYTLYIHMCNNINPDCTLEFGVLRSSSLSSKYMCVLLVLLRFIHFFTVKHVAHQHHRWWSYRQQHWDTMLCILHYNFIFSLLHYIYFNNLSFRIRGENLIVVHHYDFHTAKLIN